MANLIGSLKRSLFGIPTKRTTAKRRFGDRCERSAETFLKRKGMRILERNFEDRFGEIDLIAVDKRTVVFVEVKARESDGGGAGFEAVDIIKQKKLIKTALGYLQRNELLENAYRFDIVSILWPKTERKPQIDHYDNAFQPTDTNQMFS